MCALDNRDLTQIFGKALTGGHYELVAARDGDLAFELWSEHSPNLVILDVSRSKLDGFEVVEKARADVGGGANAVPVILLSESRISRLFRNAQIPSALTSCSVVSTARRATSKLRKGCSPGRCRFSQSAWKPYESSA
ncbi:MAG TPA: response regulator [Myxococcales bacterium]|nr:response regulator [Myxococcales bacterium]HIL99456.1 response regulator [Myxococcales bacterium]